MLFMLYVYFSLVHHHHNLSCLKPLQKRFRNDDKYRQDYAKLMQNVINQGYAEKVPISKLSLDDGQVYYIPHHGVYHQKKKEISRFRL